MNCFPPTEQAGNRREFFRGAARWLFSGLVLAAAVVGVKKRGASGETCTNQGICSGCGVLASCGLPAALSAKAFRARG